VRIEKRKRIEMPETHPDLFAASFVADNLKDLI
jgi:hypothetical protein